MGLVGGGRPVGPAEPEVELGINPIVTLGKQMLNITWYKVVELDCEVAIGCNPRSSAARWFRCVDARRAKLVLRGTRNSIFALSEIGVPRRARRSQPEPA